MTNSIRKSRELVVLALTTLLMAMACSQMAAQTYKVIYNFTGYRDGSGPFGRLTMDSAGRLYGATNYGGIAPEGSGYGNVYKLTYYNSTWVQTPLYEFAGGSDGAHPYGGVTIGPDGAIYGTTFNGGIGDCPFGGCGTVFVLRPSPTVAATFVSPWKKSTLYQFTGGGDGAQPTSEVVFRDANTMYGTTSGGGDSGCGGGCGVVYELKRTNGIWTESTVHSFANDNWGGANPGGSLVIDQGGRLYGNATSLGRFSGGTTYQLISSGSSWSENVLYQFDVNSGGWAPEGTPFLASSGKIYGTTETGNGTYGNVFELSPGIPLWSETVLYTFTGGTDGSSPETGVVGDANGNLYGTTLVGGDYDDGVVFELSPQQGGGYSYRVLHSFGSGDDGVTPTGSLIVAANGKLYGVTFGGGPTNNGVVYEITP